MKTKCDGSQCHEASLFGSWPGRWCDSSTLTSCSKKSSSSSGVFLSQKRRRREEASCGDREIRLSKRGRLIAVQFNLTWWLKRIAYNLRKLNQLSFYRTHEKLKLKISSYIRWLLTFVFCEFCEINVESMNDIRVCFVCQAWNIINNICLYFNFCWHFSK